MNKNESKNIRTSRPAGKRGAGPSKETVRRLEAEMKLKELNRRMSEVLETTSDAFVSFDRKWRYTYVNKQTEKFEGRSRRDLIGTVIWKKFPQSRKRLFYDKYREVMKTGKPAEFEELINGSWFEIRVFPSKDGIIVYYRDVTTKKLLDQRKDEFISMASHELKTPVTSIGLYTELLKQAGSDAERRSYIRQIESELSRLSKLVFDMLDISKIQVGKLPFVMRTFDLSDLVRSAVSAAAASEAERTFVMRPLPRMTVWGDRSRIIQVMNNIISNAVKYSPEGSRITVSGRVRGHFAEVTIRDKGIGIDPQYQEKIFNRFYRGSTPNKNYPGLGIGLYICKNIIERHGGEIKVKSAPGQGSSFTFTLPLRKP